ncbi:MAG: lipase, partial [Actinobacteria bacterium]|nr:lipase [Actinomycetota bacterium]
MKGIPFGLEGEPVRVAGALGLPPGRHGTGISRMSLRSLAQTLDAELPLIAASPSGVRLELRTDADVLELELHLTRLQVFDRPVTDLVLDIVVDGGAPRRVEVDGGAVLHLRGPEGMSLEDAAPLTLTIDGLGEGEKDVEIWLPHNGFAELCAVRIPDDACASAVVRPRTRWVHYGSSISHCLEARRPTETWPVSVARRHDLDLVNLGLGGHCHVDQHVARDIRDLAPDLVSLKLGVNVVNHDSFRERTFVPTVHGFLDTLRERLPDTPILILSPIVCPPAEDVPGPTLPGEDGQFYAPPRDPAVAKGALSVGRIRELLVAIVAQRVAAGDDHLVYLSGLELFGPDDAGDLYDSLHPSPEGYLVIA